MSLNKTESSFSPPFEGLGGSQPQIPHSGLLEYSLPREYALRTNGFMEPPSREPPDIPLTFEEVILGGPAPMRLSEGDHRPTRQEPVPPFLDDPASLPSKDGIKRRTLRTKIWRAWMKLNTPEVDPDFSHLPRGLDKRIDPNKDPLRDKLRRLRRRRKKSTPPTHVNERPQQCPEPIHWPAPVIDKSPPRCAPPVRPHMAFKDPGPAFDDYENPFGGEHSVLYEREEGRERRNQATQLALRDRSVSDRFLARRAQRHVRNSLIGRAPPLSRRYIQKEVKRLASAASEESQVEADPIPLGLPVDGARGFQWDRAILPSKSVPDFHAQGNNKDNYLYSASVVGSSGCTRTSEDNPVEEDKSRFRTQREPSQPAISDSMALITEWMDGVGSTAEVSNQTSINYQSAMPCGYGESSASHADLSNEDTSNYGEESDADDGYCINNVDNVGYSSEHHAEIYRREIEMLSESEPESDPCGSSTCSLSATSTPVVSPMLPDQLHNAQTPITSPHNVLEHVETETGAVVTFATDDMAQQVMMLTLGSGRVEASKPLSSGLVSLGSERRAQRGRSLFKTPSPTHPLQSNTRDCHEDNARQTLPMIRDKSVDPGFHQCGSLGTHGNHSEIPLLFGFARGEPQVINASSYVSKLRNREQTKHAESTHGVQTPATLEELNYHLPRAAMRLDYHIQRVQITLDESHKSHIPLVHRHIRRRSQNPRFQAERSLGKLSQGSLHDQYSFGRCTAYSPKEDSNDDIPLAQDGPYPKIPGRNLPSIEELTCPARRRATTTHSSSSQGTQQERDKHRTLEGNEVSHFIRRPLELLHRS